MRVTTAVLCTALSLPATAITNVEEKRAVDEKDGWNSRLELGFDAEAGNNDKRKWSTGVNTSWQNQQDRFFAWANRTYGSSNGDTTDDDTFFHGRFVHHHLQTWSQEVFAQYERDPFAALIHRALLGTGIRHQTHFDDRGRWYQGLGIFHEEVREQDDSGEYANQLTRLNIYTHLQWPLAHSMLQSTLYFQPSVDDLADQHALWQLALTLPMAEHTDLKWQWQSRWDSRPPEGTEYQNHQTHLKLVIRF